MFRAILRAKHFVILGGSASLPAIFRAHRYIIAGIPSAEVAKPQIGCAKQKV